MRSDPPSASPARERHAAAARRLQRAILATVLLTVWGLSLSFYAWLGEPGWIEVTHQTVGTPASGGRPLRVVLISDLHLRQLGSRERRVAEAVREAQPDLLVLGGDLVEGSDSLPILDAFLALVDARAPTVAVPGNWEYWGGVERDTLRRALAHRGVRLLVNEALALEHDGARYVVLGIDDATAGLPDPARAAAEAPATPNVVAVTHTPRLRDAWVGPPPTFMVAGHTHGGQVTFLGYAPALPPGSGEYVSGWYRGPPFDLYVTRGIGTSVLPIRMGARPEVAVFEWWLERGAGTARAAPAPRTSAGAATSPAAVRP